MDDRTKITMISMILNGNVPKNEVVETEESLLVPSIEQTPIEASVEKKKKAPRKASMFNLFVGDCMKQTKSLGDVKLIFKAATQVYKKVASKEIVYESGVAEMRERIISGEFKKASESVPCESVPQC